MVEGLHAGLLSERMHLKKGWNFQDVTSEGAPREEMLRSGESSREFSQEKAPFLVGLAEQDENEGKVRGICRDFKVPL